VKPLFTANHVVDVCREEYPAGVLLVEVSMAGRAKKDKILDLVDADVVDDSSILVFVELWTGS
jgi:hypothetical protein